MSSGGPPFRSFGRKHCPFVKILQRNFMVIIKDIQNVHSFTAVRTLNRVISEKQENGSPPLVEGFKVFVLLLRPHMDEVIVRLAVSGIYAIVADHLEMFFRDMLHEKRNKFHSRDSLLYISIILMSVVMKSDSIVDLVVIVDAFSSDDGSAKIAADVVGESFNICKSRFCIDIETLVVDFIHFSFNGFKGWTYPFVQEIEKYCPESIAKIGVIKMPYKTPGTIICDPAFRDKTGTSGACVRMVRKKCTT